MTQPEMDPLSVTAAAAAAAVAPAAGGEKKKSGFGRKPWTKSEDEQLIQLVSKYGPKRWASIASHLPDRIGKQCRERWTNHLRPEISKDPWRPEEDVLIFYYQKLLGNQWAEIAKYLPGRTENAIKNRFHSSLRRFQRQEKRKFGQQAVIRAMLARQGMALGALPGFGLPQQQQLALAMEMQKKVKDTSKEDEDADDGSEPLAKRARTDEAKDDGGAAATAAATAAAAMGFGAVDPSITNLLGAFDPTIMAAQQALLLNGQRVTAGGIGDPKDAVAMPPPANADVLRAALLQAAAGGNQEVLSKLLGMSSLPNVPAVDAGAFGAVAAPPADVDADKVGDTAV